MIKLNSGLRAIAVGALLVAANAVQAAPIFTVTPSANGLYTAGKDFQADALAGNSSARITYTGMSNGAYTYAGKGYIEYTAFQLNNNAVKANISGDNSAYILYGAFNQTFTCSTALQPGVSCAISSISLNLFADKGNNAEFQTATLDQDYSIDLNGDQQILLGTVTKVIDGTAGINSLGGAFQNVNTNFLITKEGQALFSAPDPFYAFAFSAFNNTSQGLTCNGSTEVAANGCGGPFTTLVINQESGITDFNDVPEPGVLALMGIGMLGLTGLRRKKAGK